MDERYQGNPRSYGGVVQPSTESAFNYNEMAKSTEPMRSYGAQHAEPSEAYRSSLYGQEQRSQAGYMGDSKGQPYRSKESSQMPSSYMYGEPERSLLSAQGVESQLDLKKGRHRSRSHYRHGKKRSRHGHGHSHGDGKHKHRKHRHHRSTINQQFNTSEHKKKTYCKCWRNFRRLFGRKSKRHRRHHRKKKRHRRRYRLSRDLSPVREKYLFTQGPPTPTMPPQSEGKTVAPPSSQPPSPEKVAPADKGKEKGKEEKAEEKKKSKEKAVKSTSVEPTQEKALKTVSKTKTADEQPPAKHETAEDDQQVQQSRKITQFIKQVAKLGMDGLKKEFFNCRSFIPNGVTKTAHDQNLIRCRYPGNDLDVICPDQTRIVLRGEEDSDFIHASRVPLGENPNEILITQLPLSNTVKHFWEMVWQENVQAILLLLTLNEWKEHAENIQLIPRKGRCLHVEDFMMLTHKNEIQVTPDWVVQEFYLSKNSETRRIFWHHYSSWEPNRPPTDGEHLWPIHSSLRKMRRPYVCMSLAGAGRAGTYAALEWAHLMLHDRSASSINVAECVRKVRAHRMHAVQTVAQFQFIYMGIQRHIFLVEKIRKEILADPTTFEATKKCSLMEHKYYQSGGYPGDDDFDL